MRAIFTWNHSNSFDIIGETGERANARRPLTTTRGERDMADENLPTAEYVRQCISYDPDTGVFRWKKRPIEHFATKRACSVWNARFSGNIAGSEYSGYNNITIDNRSYRAHRVGWLIMTGEWPASKIDHKNTDGIDNKFNNIRLATQAENGRNRGANKNNTSGFKGVFWCGWAKKWRASIKVNGRSIHIGYFPTPEEAHAAYSKSAKELHGEFARSA